ncbi:acetyl-CoA carboxylase / biotin carboxylase 1 [Marchantia polymorpha subsp. ruderalis]|uniref:Uncharacterized protein n=2 Tax=Marchantia polymorpha TaxID=3197 RepID=A0A176WL04_MARPO|nr:hypothetical protein AXG93_399s1250 [Marchantia polymorpha subsp. ruderalis]PTQ49547.1 hypothetical protein MARPO_0002s0049 [Marchantia polymorpha]BBN00335.1 hypothetical protein Mp_1g28300 [Marchantia polymorpha subsp. ruderalis]|eukprot:PTQ49547.1 hypothetical protein MARPO_0002s0049 [Marchantia polymorpha]
MVVEASANGHAGSKHAAYVSQLEEYCFALGGTKPIHSILIANNGMAAVKFIRSIRMWAYEAFGVEKAVTLVAMATPEDMRINAEHIRMADQFIEVPGGTNNNNYANIQLIVEIAERTGVSAVWPGWGHASEVPELPEQLAARGIVFLGPPAEPMAALGDKIGSSIIAQAAGVPTMAWSGSNVSIAFESCLEPIPDEVYRKACVYTTEEALASCQIIGYPVMIKASWGGGGKGIRKVNSDDEVRALFKQVQGEVPGSPIFTMKVASQSRHLEVQLLADQFGNVAALHSRDCSVQRRHQKIIEEGPITVAPPETIKALEQGACRLAKSVNYVGAATVEYLFSMETGEFYFLELNPRLQVEHPVTEWIAEFNIPAAQLCIGMGIPLWRMPEMRRFYGKTVGEGLPSWRDMATVEPFDFFTTEATKPKGHVVAVRVTSEDPDDGFKPTSGQVQELSFRSKPNVWAYFSVKSGGGIHEFSDSQFGHVFAYGETRPIAIANMVLGLKELHIRGEIRTNVDYTVDLLHDKEYRENNFHTGWLDSRIAMRVRVERPPWNLSVVGGALYRGTMLTASRVLEYIGYLEKGQVPPKHISLVSFQVTLNIEGYKYTVDMTKGGPGSYRLVLNQSEVEAEVHTLRDGGLLVQLDGNSHVVYAEEEAAGTRLLIDGRTCLLQNDHDPSRLIAETSCKLLRYLVADGSHVNADAPYAEVEVMKMCMPLVTPASGTIHCKMSEGSTMAPGDLIAGLDLDDPSAVKKAVPFEGSFPPLGPPTAVAAKVHQRCAVADGAARMVLAGYEHPIETVVQTLLTCLDDPVLPLYQWQEKMSILGTRLPKNLKNKLDMEFREYETSFIDNKVVEFPAKSLKAAIEAAIAEVPESDRSSIIRLVEPLVTLVKSYEGGRESHARSTVKSLFDEYLRVEKLFSTDMQADVIEGLRQTYKKDLPKVVDIVLSHQGVSRKNVLISRLMGALVYPNPAAYREQLICFAELSHPSQSELALRSSQLLEQTKLSDLRANIARSLSELEMFTEEGGDGTQVPGRRRSAVEERMEDLVDAPLAVEDALVALFDHSDHTLQRRVVETYIRRLYQPYLVKGSIRMQWHRSGLIASWQFMEENPQQANEKMSTLAPLEEERQGIRRWGTMAILTSLHYLANAVGAALKETGEAPKDAVNGSSREFGNIIHVALVGIKNQMSNLQDSGDEDQAQERVDKIAKSLKSESLGSMLTAAGVGIVSCIIQRDEGRSPTRHCFHWAPDQRFYEEEPLSRHVEPPLSNLLELNKLKGFASMRYAPSRDRQWHIYYVTDKPSNVKRTFLRTLVRQVKPSDNAGVVDVAHATKNVEGSIQRILEELELIVHDSNNKADHLHMYLSLLRPVEIGGADTSGDDEDIEQVDVVEKLKGLVHDIYKKLGARMHRLAVWQWEIRLRLTHAGCAIGAWRIVAQNPTGHTCTVQVYKEVKNAVLGVVVYHSPLPASYGPLHGKPIATQHKPLDAVERRRLTARRNNTTYCYDFPLIFEKALELAWLGSNSTKMGGSPIFKATELIFVDKKNYWNSSLVEVTRPVASNDVGMVAWSIRMRTPEFPEGRAVFVVSNDVTYNVGSFGQKEDAFFKAVTDLAVQTKLPLIYLAANSGARIGVSDEVRSSFRVGWSDESSPDRGFQYLYLTPEDYQLISTSVVSHEIQLPSGEVRWVIDDIIGKEDGLGVENLSGSGAIAGAYSRAYQETFTLTYVSGRTVGIGAYLARLGMRCIQRSDQPIILTGFPALNKLLGREVYSSHMQLGGPKVMAVNGVTHLTVADDLEGVSSILNWLSYVPAVKGGPLPFLHATDPPQRLVEYTPETSCDPRAAIRGIEVDGKWLGGIFDKGSFVETLEGWAQTVVTGRGRLGGIPVGIVAVETQTVMQTIPADPGQPDSHERVVPQAGQVWFPDSAAKTAQALLDFNKEGLPLFILANWRGFSGGQRDLFEGILQAGSMIVEHLRTYKQPVFVFIPKTGELRGGAWVVVDSKINVDQVEMYAERTAKGGVLEPEGLIEIKFREREIKEVINRLDSQVIGLKQKMQAADAQTALAITKQITARENKLLPLYKQIAIRFAELHDTANRMAAKGVIKKPVEWAQSRYFFHRRLKRRLVEEALVRQVQDAAGDTLSHADALALIKKWYLEAQEPKFDYVANDAVSDAWDDNRAFVAWGNQPCVMEEHLQGMRKERVSKELYAMAGTSSGNLKALPEALRAMLQQVDEGSRNQAVQELKTILESFK